MASSLFGHQDDHPADLLSNAAAVTCFLSEVATAMAPSLAETGLSDDGVFGFTQILNVIESTIKEAVIKL